MSDLVNVNYVQLVMDEHLRCFEQQLGSELSSVLHGEGGYRNVNISLRLG
jgi:hypothetical protein